MATKQQRATKKKSRVQAVDIPDGLEAGSKQKFQIVGYAEIPVENVEANPRNPRPKFQMDDDDPVLLSLGESIRVDGQHSPAVVYELVNHYDDNVDDQPGHYRLYQGESRWRACRIADVETLRCFITTTPQSSAEEMEWMGIEDAFKRDWQPFFVLRYANDLAKELGVPVYSQEISVKTGVSMSDLKIAEKIFKLEPPIQYFAAEYEELMYDQLVKGKRRRGTRLTGPGIRAKEFPVNKAAAVYDIFEALREHAPLVVKGLSDLELQQLIAQKATRGSTIEDLQRLHGQIKQLGSNPPTGLLTEIDELVKNDDRGIKDTVRATGADEYKKLKQFMSRAPKLRSSADQIIKVLDRVSSDPDDLLEVQREALEVLRDVNTFEREISRRIDELNKERAR